ncbi:MAG: TonB-dependent receptor [Massilia sp.]|nr:TonB-dependent receptor [Massilia sp.]
MFRKTVVARALAIAFSAATLTLAVSAPVMAQSNATGNIVGRVDVPAGASVHLTNLDTGLQRAITPDATGRYQATALPVGRYKVELKRGDKVEKTQEVEVILGQGVDASFSAAAITSIQVTGRRNRIDVSNTTNGSTFTARELAKLPIAPSVGAIIQLTPGTTRGDSRYGDINAPSIGGASASGNAFYINGFPTTNVLLQVGSSELPFGAISQAQILSGGYSAEFGRSTGGVSNITTKSGTNTWEIGAQYTQTPNSMRSQEKNLYYANTGKNPITDGKVYLYNSNNQVDRKSYAVLVGGPIIKDKLFFFADVETIKSNIQDTRVANNARATATPNAWEMMENRVDRSLVKIDWNITDNHRLEYTNMVDAPNSDRKYYSYDYNTNTRGTVQTGGNYYENWGPVPSAAAQGAKTQILKYTGNLTDDLTLTVLGGKSRVDHINNPFGLVPGLFQTNQTSDGRAAGINYVNPQLGTGNVLTPGAFDEQKVYRLDLEYKIGSHTLRAGLDHNNIASKAGTEAAGGGSWLYQRQLDALGNPDPNGKPYPTSNSPASGGGLGSQAYFVQKILLNGVSTPTVEQAAQYIEDRYQVTKDVLVSLGLRNEQFTNFNGEGVAYYSQRHQLAPRLGVSWDVNGDASLKISGNAGRYHLQIPTNVAVRGAGSSLNASQYYTYTGVDQATGAPTGLVPISALVSANNEFGQAVPAAVVAAVGMKSHYQDEISLGFEKAFSPNLNFGAKATYRKLQSTVDDFCDDRPFYKYAAAHNINADNFAFRCALFNPGIGNTFNVEYGGPGAPLTRITLSAAELGYEQVVRTYKSVDVFAEHPLRNGWYAKASYTWSRSYGNTEGQTLSDIGQADVATTQAWDFPEIGLYSTGLTPNDRTHQLKAFGFYELSPQFSLGANALLASGRVKNCKGSLPASFNTPTPNPAAAYGSAFFFCNGVPTPRGSQGNLPIDARLDLNLTFKPAMAKDLAFKVDVFNVLNRQADQNIEERYNVGSTTAIATTYGRTISYTAPRSVKLTAEFNHKF